MRPSINVQTQVAIATSKDSLYEQIRLAEENGWAWDGKVANLTTCNTQVLAAALVSLTAVAAVEGSPRIKIGR